MQSAEQVADPDRAHPHPPGPARRQPPAQPTPPRRVGASRHAPRPRSPARHPSRSGHARLPPCPGRTPHSRPGSSQPTPHAAPRSITTHPTHPDRPVRHDHEPASGTLPGPEGREATSELKCAPGSTAPAPANLTASAAGQGLASIPVTYSGGRRSIRVSQRPRRTRQQREPVSVEGGARPGALRTSTRRAVPRCPDFYPRSQVTVQPCSWRAIRATPSVPEAASRTSARAALGG